MISDTDLKQAGLDEWLNRLESLHPTEIDLGLERLRKVAGRLGVETLPGKVITVAGTNGKGSTVAMLDSVLRQAGYKTGCYTSPHFLRYNERICLNGHPVPDQMICDAFLRIEAARQDISLTYFEFGTLAAFLIFSDEAPDVSILEIGLGGRLDAANLIDPDLAIVTTVALDHESWLGSDLEQIGREKAGIFRKDIPVVIGSEAGKIPASVREEALRIGASDISQLGQEYRWFTEADGSWSWQSLDDDGKISEECLLLPAVSLPTDNAATVIQALNRSGFDISTEALYRGLQSASLTGRMQSIGRFVLDVAHNPHAAHYIAEKLQSMPVKGRRVALVGMLDDKDVESVLNIMAPVFSSWYIAQLEGPRATPALRIQEYLANEQQTDCRVFPHVAEALDAVLAETGADDQVLVFGSFLTVAGVLEVKERLLP
ncbi:bifunctional tetrahydrofolate synthase/dihydrofolate synthase [Oceanospirillum sediminis]|uniref:Dihydrofolate synthase/folylpolyglutamate synthase n=1 Tax=Oceanospirillum sediminis TaxID=2760088 RepID=A0A839IRB4_9GAMM|nr:bifunctional tetrahydrofolate synthase/dihydrofolate synthase [Oceanospirillum sediminis]MBB1487039.1 bifunctional tetrahydrofolate synthase/dihydrofolate synthase [Oceanospirillum sediminis]